MIEQDLYAHLVAQVPTVEGRVFANIMAQDTPKPALVYTVLTETPARLSSACDDARNGREWMIHIYHTEYMANKTVKTEVTAALRSFATAVHGIVIEDGFDEESELFVQIIQFKTGVNK